MKKCDLAIIGAGPYGLSLAAYLKAYGVNFRIFGQPMDFWLSHMPKGMKLKSEGFASSLYDPKAEFTLKAYCNQKGIEYADSGIPVPLEVFAAYGLEFQKRLVPELEKKLVAQLQRTGEGFQLRLDDGEVLLARRVVIATGLTHYENLPPALAQLPQEFVTHSSMHTDLDHFKGRQIVVVGGGASALDIAALLNQVGAHVQVVVRESRVRFHDPPAKGETSLLNRLRSPVTGIGPGWKLYLCTNAPLLFRQMPKEFRFEKVKTILGPAPGWFVKEQIVGKVPVSLGVSITEAKVQDGRVVLQLTDKTHSQSTIVADHVISGTGYKVDLGRLPFLDADLKSRVQTADNTPVLSSNFETSVRGLYMIGACSAYTFGPLLRFAFGAGFTAKRLSRHLRRNAKPVESASNTPANLEVKESDELAIR